MLNNFKKHSIDSENEITAKYRTIKTDSNQIKYFTDIPLSLKTIRGLTHLNYIYPTVIQRESINLALQGKDVIGCATTGSGKTLAFLIPIILNKAKRRRLNPTHRWTEREATCLLEEVIISIKDDPELFEVLERLYANKWSSMDGIGAIIISPTRELAYQIFETLKKVGKYHEFSVGLIIGGKNLKFEKKRMDRCNIIICTPGRLLQHMDENPLFNGINTQILVLDEADRCLDMGFENVINAIIENLPPHRQTLLFSATQTQSVKDLMRLNLNNSVHVGPKDLDKVVPALLQQNYIVVALKDKITMLWSFMKNHLKQKCIVFLASCKQVKYVYEIFCKIRPGTSLLALYGTLHQDRRIAIYNEFVNKRNVFLFATDIASRGLDFPAINWVIQLDCPENVTQYIHRAGRSARNKERGESLLVLTPSEEHAMIKEMKRNSIDIKLIHIDASKLFSPLSKIEAFLAQNPNLKASAKRAFTGYIKSVYNMKNKSIFDVRNINFDAFAKSLGLVITPRIRFIDNKLKKIDEKERFEVNDLKLNYIDNNQYKFQSYSDELFTIKNSGNIESKLGRIDNFEINIKTGKKVSKVAQAKKCLKKKIIKNTIKYNEDGTVIVDLKTNTPAALPNLSSDIESIGGINMLKVCQMKQRSIKNIYSNIFDDGLNTTCYQYDQLQNADKKHNKLIKTLWKQDDKQASENKNLYPKRRKLSTKLSVEEAETIATQILL